MEKIEIFRTQNARVGFGVMSADPVAVDERKRGAQHDCTGPPPRTMFPGYRGRCGQAQGKEMEEMWDEEGRQSIVEVGVWFIGDAKGAVRQDVRAIGEIEASGIEGGETEFKPLVGVSEGGAWTHQAETSKENVIRCLQSGGSDGKNVFW